VTKGDVKKGLLRLRNWKKVCEQYDFKNVGEKHGTQWIKDHANSLVFSVGQDKNGCNGYGVNLGSFLPSVLKTDYEMQCYVAPPHPAPQTPLRGMSVCLSFRAHAAPRSAAQQAHFEGGTLTTPPPQAPCGRGQHET